MLAIRSHAYIGSPLNRVSPSLLKEIIYFLTGKDLLLLGCSDQRMRELSKTPKLWRRIFANEFPNIIITNNSFKVFRLSYKATYQYQRYQNVNCRGLLRFDQRAFHFHATANESIAFETNQQLCAYKVAQTHLVSLIAYDRYGLSEFRDDGYATLTTNKRILNLPSRFKNSTLAFTRPVTSFKVFDAYVAVGHDNGEIAVYGLYKSEPIAKFRSTSFPGAVTCFAINGTLLYSGSTSCYICCWNLTIGKLENSLRIDSVPLEMQIEDNTLFYTTRDNPFLTLRRLPSLEEVNTYHLATRRNFSVRGDILAIDTMTKNRPFRHCVEIWNHKARVFIQRLFMYKADTVSCPIVLSNYRLIVLSVDGNKSHVDMWH